MFSNKLDEKQYSTNINSFTLKSLHSETILNHKIQISKECQKKHITAKQVNSKWIWS